MFTCAYHCKDILFKFSGKFSMNSYYNGYVFIITDMFLHTSSNH